MLSDHSARFRAIAELQSLRRRSSSFFRVEQIDHAIDLALQPRRKVDDYLVRNLLRDSARVVARRAKAARETAASQIANADDDRDPYARFQDALVECSTPEGEVIALETKREALKTIHSIRYGARVLDCIIEGRTTRQIAAELGISTGLAAKLAKRASAALQAPCEEVVV